MLEKLIIELGGIVPKDLLGAGKEEGTPNVSATLTDASIS